ncbi:MAG: trigger factor, partial [Planctomycetota bacterium]
MSDTSTPTVDAKVEDAGPCLKKLSITVPAAMVKDEIDSAFMDVIRNLRVPGFRPGHLPRKVAEARFGDAVRHEVRNNLLEKAFQDALEQHGLTPLSNPDLETGDAEMEVDKDFSFELTLEVKPEISVPDLSDIILERSPIEVKDEDIDSAIDSIRMDRAELRPVDDGALEEKDVAVIDVAVLVEGERVLDAENLQYRHPSDVIAGIGAKGISDEMLGSKPDDEKTVAVTLPANFKLLEHAGADAELQVTVREIKRFHLPEVDEEFAKSLDFDDISELREEASKAVQRNKEEQEEKRLDKALLDAVIAKAPIELPEGIVKKEIGQVLARYQAELHMQGATPEVIEER